MEKIYIIVRHDNADGIQSNLCFVTNKQEAIRLVARFNDEAKNGLTLSNGEIEDTEANTAIMMSEDAIWYEYDEVSKSSY